MEKFFYQLDNDKSNKEVQEMILSLYNIIKNNILDIISSSKYKPKTINNDIFIELDMKLGEFISSEKRLFTQNYIIHGIILQSIYDRDIDFQIKNIVISKGITILLEKRTQNIILPNYKYVL